MYQLIDAVRLPRDEAEDIHERAFGYTFTLDVDFGDEYGESQIDLYHCETGMYLLLSFVEPNDPAVAFRLNPI